MQMLTGFFVTQIVDAVATYPIADHLAKGPATAEQIAKIEGIHSSVAFRLLRACASLGLVFHCSLRHTLPIPSATGAGVDMAGRQQKFRHDSEKTKLDMVAPYLALFGTQWRVRSSVAARMASVSRRRRARGHSRIFGA